MPERSSRAQGEVASTLLFKIFQKGNDHLIHLAWDETISAATPLHLFVNGAFIPIVKTCTKWVMTLSSSMAMYSVMRDIPWCKKGTNRKRMSCSSPICHMQIFKSFDFRTMGLWIWIYLYFDTHCICLSMSHCKYVIILITWLLSCHFFHVFWYIICYILHSYCTFVFLILYKPLFSRTVIFAFLDFCGNSRVVNFVIFMMLSLL